MSYKIILASSFTFLSGCSNIAPPASTPSTETSRYKVIKEYESQLEKFSPPKSYDKQVRQAPEQWQKYRRKP